jgi:hypothetical protein
MIYARLRYTICKIIKDRCMMKVPIHVYVFVPTSDPLKGISNVGPPELIV